MEKSSSPRDTKSESRAKFPFPFGMPLVNLVRHPWGFRVGRPWEGGTGSSRVGRIGRPWSLGRRPLGWIAGLAARSAAAGVFLHPLQIYPISRKPKNFFFGRAPGLYPNAPHRLRPRTQTSRFARKTLGKYPTRAAGTQRPGQLPGSLLGALRGTTLGSVPKAIPGESLGSSWERRGARPGGMRAGTFWLGGPEP